MPPFEMVLECSNLWSSVYRKTPTHPIPEHNEDSDYNASERNLQRESASVPVDH